MIETLAYGYSYESTQRELSHEYQHDRVLMVFKEIFACLRLDESSLSIGLGLQDCVFPKTLHHCALDERSSLSIVRTKEWLQVWS